MLSRQLPQPLVFVHVFEIVGDEVAELFSHLWSDRFDLQKPGDAQDEPGQRSPKGSIGTTWEHLFDEPLVEIDDLAGLQSAGQRASDDRPRAGPGIQWTYKSPQLSLLEDMISTVGACHGCQYVV